jgi:predicted enzyme related to lactoylglutathione lyase
MNQHQNFCMDYIEFPATDIDGTKRFYREVFGWDFQDWGPNYVSFHDGRMGGGFTTESEVASPARKGVLVVLYAANLEETYTRVKTAGGKIARETFEFPGGRRFHFSDPNGNELAVWSE